jgi:hypothetical protein
MRAHGMPARRDKHHIVGFTRAYALPVDEYLCIAWVRCNKQGSDFAFCLVLR